jgi:hypothetical protein
MGKATIVGGGDKGSYTIKMDYGTATRDATVAALAQHLTELATKITEAQTKLDAAKAAEAEKKTAAQKATNDYIAATQAIPKAFEDVSSAMDAVENLAASATATPEERKAAQDALTAAEAAYTAAQDAAKEALSEQTKAATALVEAKKKTAPLQLALDALVDEQTKLQKDKAYWEGLQLESTLQAWCADYTENGSGEVATMEIPGENQIVLIKPGAPAGNTVDGVLRAREVQSPEQVFFNAAILPGWQKWKPTYRRGTITALDTNTNRASVALDNDTSSAQGLDINQTPALTNVPVRYMTCHAAAFNVGDRCVVRFGGMDWASPEVVGFVDNPKPCDSYFYFFIQEKSDALVVESYVADVWAGLFTYQGSGVYGTYVAGGGSFQREPNRLSIERQAGVTMPATIAIKEWDDRYYYGASGSSRLEWLTYNIANWRNGVFFKSFYKMPNPYAVATLSVTTPPSAPDMRTSMVIAGVTAGYSLVLGDQGSSTNEAIADFAAFEAYAKAEFTGVPQTLDMVEDGKNYKLIFDGFGDKGAMPGLKNPDGTPLQRINNSVRYIKRRM